MGWYTRTLASTFPAYFVRRERSRRVYRALYEAETPTKQFKRKTTTGGPNTATRTATRNLRQAARHAEENWELADHALNVLVANLVGRGCWPQPMVRDTNGELLEEVNAEIEDWHKLWRRRPEVTWEHSEELAQALTVRSWMRDGEVLHQHFLGDRAGLTHGLQQVPYSYQLIESDLLPTEGETRSSRLSSQTLATGKVIQGIEFNTFNRAVAYHLYREHPGDVGFSQSRNFRIETKRIPARVITHLKLIKRINQARGVSVFDNVLRRLEDVNEIDESERVAARVAAAIAAVIVKGDSFMYTPPGDSDAEYRDLDMEPGMFFDDLHPGERVETVGSQRPNNELIPFRSAQLKAGAGGLSIGYSDWSKDYDHTYSAQRQELVAQQSLYTPLWARFVSVSEWPKYNRFVMALRLTNTLKLPANVDMRTLSDAIYNQPLVPWIDPQKEAAGWEKLIALGGETRANLQRMRGHNPRDIDRQRRRENDDPINEPVVRDPQRGQGGQRPG